MLFGKSFVQHWQQRKSALSLRKWDSAARPFRDSTTMQRLNVANSSLMVVVVVTETTLRLRLHVDNTVVQRCRDHQLPQEDVSSLDCSS